MESDFTIASTQNLNFHRESLFVSLSCLSTQIISLWIEVNNQMRIRCHQLISWIYLKLSTYQSLNVVEASAEKKKSVWPIFFRLEHSLVSMNFKFGFAMTSLKNVVDLSSLNMCEWIANHKWESLKRWRIFKWKHIFE